MKVNLGPDAEQFVRGKLSQGFDTPESVVGAALDLMRQQDEAYSAWVHAQAEEGLAALDEGRWVEATPELREEIKRRGRERLAASRQKTA